MLKRYLLTPLALAAVLASGFAADAMAARQRTFVASDGLDSNGPTFDCDLANPCRTFTMAVAHTQLDGEVIVLDSAGYGAAIISQAVSIIAPPGIYAGIAVQAPGGPGLTVNAPGGKVTLRGLTINNVSGGTSGIVFVAGSSLYVDGVIVTNFPTAGVSAIVGASSTLTIANSIFRDNGTGGVFNTSSGTLTVTIENSLFARNTTGLNFTDGTVGSVHFSTVSGGTTGLSTSTINFGKMATIQVRDCTISDNSGVGVTATQLGAGSPVTLVSLVSSLISGNATGIQVSGNNSSVYVSDSTIVRNGTGVNPVLAGTIVSGFDNRLVSNTVNGAFSSIAPKL